MEKTVTPHYVILDGLRGVAAIAVLFYHLFEAVAFAAGATYQSMYHGFLAVDFFFILSGFVMGYAYDGGWNRLSVGHFIRRRLIRLHPMVVMGTLLGLAAYCFQGAVRWDGTSVPTLYIIIGTLMGLFLLPVPTSMEVRGNTEAFPLNGPHWSLFFEYIGSLMYALLLRRLSVRYLTVWVGMSFCLLVGYALYMNEGGVAYGWSSEPMNLLGGFLRMNFAYPLGLLLSRHFRHRVASPLSGPVFLLSSCALLVLLVIPYLGSWGLLFQLCCIALAFPFIVWVGARGVVAGGMSAVAHLLGRISYPLYAIHYPLIYLYIHWINTHQSPFGPYGWCTPVALFCISLLAAYLLARFYDEPLRRKLSRWQGFFRHQ